MKKRAQVRKKLVIKSDLTFDEILKACADTPPVKTKQKTRKNKI